MDISRQSYDTILYKLYLYTGAPKEDIQDALQEAHLNILLRSEDSSPIESIDSFLLVSAKNILLNSFKRKSFQKRAVTTFGAPEWDGNCLPACADFKRVSDQIDGSKILDYVDEMNFTEKRRDALMHKIQNMDDGRSEREHAEELGVSRETYNTQARLAMDEIRNSWNKYCARRRFDAMMGLAGELK